MIIKGQTNSIILLLYLLASGHQLFGAIVINNVSTTPSTCANNGSVTVDATSSPDPFLLYRIVAGPVTTPMQNSNTFNSLFPGTYTVRLYDIDLDSIETQVTVTGNYELPNYFPIPTNPTCQGFSDGMIVGNADSTRGREPFTWQIVSPISVGPQSTDTFAGLDAGTYQLRMTDSCSNFQTRTVVLGNAGTGLTGPAYTIAEIIGCDTTILRFHFRLSLTKGHLPVSFSVETDPGSGPVTITSQQIPNFIGAVNAVQGSYYVADTFSNMSFGSLADITLTDTCGLSINSPFQYVAPFEYAIVTDGQNQGCTSSPNNLVGAMYTGNNGPYHQTEMRLSVSATMVDLNTNTEVYNDTCYSGCAALTFGYFTVGTPYLVTITDECGRTVQDTLTWPPSVPDTATCNNPLKSPGCTDSSAYVYFSCSDFALPMTLTIHSGPPQVSSSKPGFAHQATYTYPFVHLSNSYSFSVRDLSEGTYTYSMTDSCGNLVTGSFNVYFSNLADLNFVHNLKRGCLGENTLYFDIPSKCILTISDSTGNVIFNQQTGAASNDSLNSLQPGNYFVEIEYDNDGVSLAGYPTCWTFYDTLTIAPHTYNSFRSATEIYCSGITYLEVNVDSGQGVPPFQYEIISGPQTFPLQNNNQFLLSGSGSYIIRVVDSCANTSTQQITVDSDTIPEINKAGIACVGSRVVLSTSASPYFDYQWTLPDGSIQTDNELIIDPFTTSDTGTYSLNKYVFINGCVDTFFATYQLNLNDSFPQTVNICPGDTFIVGNSIYTGTGVYRDTLQSQTGCDSVVITDLLVVDGTPIVTDTSICAGQQLQINDQVYTTAGTYFDTLFVSPTCYQANTINLSVVSIASTIDLTICQGDVFYVGNSQYTTSGNYVDTITTSGNCDSIVHTQLTVVSADTSLFINTCFGDTIRVGNSIYTNTAGTFQDTLVSQFGCDSVVTTNIILQPYFLTINDTTICAGEFVTVGNNTYNSTGWYRDTIYDASGCQSILRTNLTVLNIIDTVSTQICSGDTLFVGNNAYTSSGFYVDTFTNSIGCDSTVVTELIVSSNSQSVQNFTICQGAAITIDGKTYATEGTYYDTLVSSFGCDSLVTTVIDLHPEIAVEATADTTAVLPNQPIQLNAVANGILTFYWTTRAQLTDPNLQDPIGYITEGAWFIVTVADSNNLCPATDSIYISLLPESECNGDGLFMPNAFTPNGDGRNDYLEIFVDCPLKEFDLKIFNRWGELVFHSEGVDHKWDGRFKGELQRPDVYVYYIQALSNSNKRIYKEGSVTLVR